MKKLLLTLVILFTPMVLMVIPTMSAQAASAPTCKTSFFGIPTWYEYLKLSDYPNCEVQLNQKIATTTKDSNGNEVSVVNSSIDLTDIWLIVLAVIDILMTVAGVLAVVFVIVGGFKLVTSQATPDKIANARNTITYAVVGLVVAILASQIVGFIAGKLGQ